MQVPVRSAGSRLGGEGGQAAIFATVGLTFLFGTLGLSVDLGWAYFLKQRVQTAADAAAGAAAVYAMNNVDTCGNVSCGVSYTCAGVSPPTNAMQAGCLYATVDGPPVLTAKMIENNGSHPPSGLTGNTPTMWIQATVTASNANIFLFLSGFQSASINAQAIGGFNTSGGSDCIYALSSSGTSLSDSGSGNISSTCGISDNGGFSDTASGNISTTELLVNGNFSDSASGSITATSKVQVGGTYSGGGHVSPAYTTGTSTITDPFAGISPPSVGACTYTNFSISDASAHTLSPGVYCGGLSLSNSGNITFNSGTYIINGGSGSLSFNYAGAGDLSGTNVTFFITGKNGYSAMPISIAGSGNMTFSAPSSGTCRGLLFYQDASASYAGTNTWSGSGNVTGTFYFPTTSLSYSGSGTARAQALVANKITFTGSGNFTKDLTGQYTGLVKSIAGLLQ